MVVAPDHTDNTLFDYLDGTAVTWSMSGHQNFLEKAVCLVMNGKKMIGDQLDQGLGPVGPDQEVDRVGVHQRGAWHLGVPDHQIGRRQIEQP